MTTRLELRTALRLRLEDSGVAPLWDDATLNEILAAAIRAYGVAVPRQVTTGVTVPAGATKVATGVIPRPGPHHPRHRRRRHLGAALAALGGSPRPTHPRSGVALVERAT